MWIKSAILMFTLVIASTSSFAEEEAVIVELIKFKFVPAELTVKVGTTVRWVNKEKRQYHSVWFREQGDTEADYFFPGETYERTFNEPGDFPYVCEPHEKDSNMVGIVHVVAE